MKKKFTDVILNIKKLGNLFQKMKPIKEYSIF